MSVARCEANAIESDCPLTTPVKTHVKTRISHMPYSLRNAQTCCPLKPRLFEKSARNDECLGGQRSNARATRGSEEGSTAPIRLP